MASGYPLTPILRASPPYSARYNRSLMQFQRIQNATDLLGQAPPPPPPTSAHRPDSRTQLHGKGEPKLEIAWGGFHQGFWSSVAAIFGPRGGKRALESSPFRDSWVEGRIPKRAVVAA